MVWQQWASERKEEISPSRYMDGTTQQREMDKLAKLMEGGKGDLDFLLFDGSGDPHFHLKAYLDKLPKNDDVPNPLHEEFDPNKHCAFHSGMEGHDTNECFNLKKEIQKLISSGRISQRPRSQLVWYQPPKFIPTSNYTPTYHPPFTMRLPIQIMWYPPPTIAPTLHYIPTPSP
ncbi:hypothetical protein HAX54_011023 [Datura stramonium]|uniref:Uncharacterized protein n=1 Tax=Datura stramonium TaxID=4076 RepID=A0ABS8RYU1_DATST|nr:hypothetical protein [Datura stramonium]